MQLSVCAQFISFAAELFPTAANNTANPPYWPLPPLIVTAGQQPQTPVCICARGFPSYTLYRPKGYVINKQWQKSPFESLCLSRGHLLVYHCHLTCFFFICCTSEQPHVAVIVGQANTLFRLIYWLAAAAFVQAMLLPGQRKMPWLTTAIAA